MNKIVNTLIAKVLHDNNVSIPIILDSYSNEDNFSCDGCDCDGDVGECIDSGKD